MQQFQHSTTSWQLLKYCAIFMQQDIRTYTAPYCWPADQSQVTLSSQQPRLGRRLILRFKSLFEKVANASKPCLCMEYAMCSCIHTWWKSPWWYMINGTPFRVIDIWNWTPTHCMPDEARDGRNVCIWIIKWPVGVLDRPKEPFYYLVGVFMIVHDKWHSVMCD